ncbi:glycoside hydrolase family 97 protein [Riemerella anatipestifer]|uniref:Glycoside hydrolase 97 n=1 Tax=Riemerella anatipestifer (strain ATCC 11845 / DSM 15868 / JCM 9532 / NCTC 11014) TaxID=693978 RepID=E4TAX2_RIEAD|nr:glycoside hydrolase family 97 protein [Riemerella anatipestifer]ADQ81208.1 Glycoside hydrolase 97 [Riemerella anatipestifer ATCC 11845 = DSM 15868]AFD55238.1 glycoside hydrolase 97 [Riemerella anatipestifer ATCC 11845 = DSM 15868]MRM93122.1 glycoside hydrolase family 97 protein [Riemerella anatipestifer]MRN05540.1 glycoside hydrolase family 97 protein [Riemerella anatipestifer]MSN90718.1 glycoside hydrolase family 97 protein [Riemerella anatipestifer]
MKKRNITIAFLGLSFGVLSAQSLKSPDGKFEMNFKLENGVPYYSLSYEGNPVLEPSKLGFEVFKKSTYNYKDISNQESLNLSSGFVKIDEKRDSKNEDWQPVLGEKKFYKNHYNELAITLNQKEQNKNIVVKFRLFNDGLGFRYEFPQQENLNYFIIKEELTEFDFPMDMKAWWLAGDYDTQEYVYQTSNVSEIPAKWAAAVEDNVSQSPIKNGVQTPLMLKREGKKPLYINLAEAAVIDYPASNLDVSAKDYKFTIHLTPDAQGAKGYVQTSAVTPWRTIIASPKAEEVLASKMLFNLNEPTKYKDTSWIKPTKYMGVWWEMIIGKSQWAYSTADNVKIGETDFTKLTPNGKHAANNEKVKNYIDFASKHGFDALLIEGWNIGWEDWFGKSKEFVFDFVTPYPDFDIKMLNDYAHKKGIRLMMHHETSGAATNYERWADEAFKLMNKYGYTAVKSGYVGNIIPRGEHHYSQWMINHYNRIAEKAANYKIMVNSHESVRPSGLNRTYPNWVAAEAARGTEYEVFGGNPPEHQTILPFTRFMGGPMDYTPGIFQTKMNYYFPNDTRFVKTTLAKQLGLYVVMYSPLQMAADLPENYEKHLEAFQFIKDVAVDWDDTKILAAEPGDYIHTARKAKGKEEWFVGGITDENARDFVVDLSFLDKGRKYEATIYEDGKDADYVNNPQSYHIYKKVVTSKSKIPVKMVRSGGYAISIKPVK